MPTGTPAQAINLDEPDAQATVRFTELVSLRELSDGSVLLVDRGENRLVHYDWGDHVGRDLGRTGRGPGEYQFVGRLYPAGTDSTLLTDARTGRWLLLTGSDIVGTISENRRLNQLLGWRLGGGTGRSVLGVSGFVYSGSRRMDEAADSLLLLVADWTNETTDTIARLKGAGQAGFTRIPARGGRPMFMVGGNPLDTEEQGLLFEDGAVAVARLNPYRVDWRLPSGRWVMGEPVPFRRREVSDDVKCAAMQGFVPPDLPCTPDLLPGWPETIPPFLRRLKTPVLLEAPDALLAIARTFVGDSPTRRYDLIDREGRRRGTLEVAANQYVVGFGRNTIYVAETDTLGRQSLRRHRWPVR